MDLLYLASTSPQSGKTVVASALGLLARERGFRVAYRSLGGSAADVAFAGAVLSGAADMLPAPSREALSRLASQADFVLLEGEADATVAGALGARVLLVTWYQEGMDVTDLRQAIAPFGERLAGLLLNGVPETRLHHAQTALLPALRAAGVPLVGVLPQRRLLMAPTLRELVEFLGAEVLAFPEKLDELVESLMIGALALDGGIYYFGQQPRKVVITRWDRPDLQMPALATGCQGLIVTGGKPPIPYVWDRLQELRVPVAMVQSGTIAAASRLNEGFLAQRGRPHERKVQEMMALVRETPGLLSLVAGAPAAR